MRELQAEMIEARAAAAVAADESEDRAGVAGGPDGRRRGVNRDRRIKFSKINQQRSDATDALQPQSPPVAADPVPDVVQSPEEAALDKHTELLQAGQPASRDEQQPQSPATPTPQSPAVAAAEMGAAVGAPGASEEDEPIFVAGIQGGARPQDIKAEQAEEEAEWGKKKWKKRWRHKQPGTDKEERDDDD